MDRDFRGELRPGDASVMSTICRAMVRLLATDLKSSFSQLEQAVGDYGNMNNAGEDAGLASGLVTACCRANAWER